MNERQKETNRVAMKWTRGSILVIVTLVGLSMWGCPSYNVYTETKAGEAELKKAEQNRQIVVQEAQAENEAAISKADTKIILAEAANTEMVIRARGESEAEVIRAEGVAQANKIIGESLKGNESYLHYLWIDQLDKGSQKIYIPTEANMPILEAGK